jgi:hypothetical protein
MNQLLALMLAYVIVSTGSVLLSMRTTIGPGFRLMSLLYLMVTVGLALFFLNQILSIPRPFNQEYLVQAGKAGSPDEGDARLPARWQQLASMDKPAVAPAGR